jgi:hypothetical protein
MVKLPKKPKQNEPAKESINEPAKEPEFNDAVGMKVLVSLQELLQNPLSIARNEWHPNTCQGILNTISELIIHKGMIIDGLRSLDGMVMFPCPKHGYAPVTGCIVNKCEFFNGTDIGGICMAKQAVITGHKTFTWEQARKEEERLRMDLYQKNLVMGTVTKEEEESKEEKKESIQEPDIEPTTESPEKEDIEEESHAQQEGSEEEEDVL